MRNFLKIIKFHCLLFVARQQKICILIFKINHTHLLEYTFNEIVKVNTYMLIRNVYLKFLNNDYG